MIGLEKALRLKEQCKLDGLLITDDYNRRYLSGYTGAEGMLVIGKRQYLLTDFRYIEQAEMECRPYGIQTVDIGVNGYETTLKHISEQECIKSFGFEDKSISYDGYRRLKDKLEGIQFIPVGFKVNQLRIIKNKEELEFIKEAEHIGDLAFSHILDYIKPGKTEREIALELEVYMKQHGASGLSFDTIVASGKNSSMPHAMVSDKKIENGDFVTMDFGCVYQGYCSDMTRTIVVGKTSEKQKKIYQTVLHAQEEALHMLKAGVICSKADKVARDIINENGYEGCFGHGLGHSVGLYIHEEPRLSTKCEEVLKAGMTMTVEPGIYLLGYGGVRIEDLVAITEEGIENFTHSAKNLIEL